ncbi:hypothetical protein [Microcoleus sp. N3A4]|uniref:hypothetical protein n=1 Tax=Microcoleus sp. N3A4 TaxID=3055379 RepID=UPI002FCF20B4
MAEAALRTNSTASYYSKLSIHRRSLKRMSGTITSSMLLVQLQPPQPNTGE